jgi:hypothetical protein
MGYYGIDNREGRVSTALIEYIIKEFIDSPSTIRVALLGTTMAAL